MRCQILVAIAIAIAIASETVPAADPVTGAMTRFGIYEMVGPASGPWRVWSVSTTAEIPARQGLRFGFDLELSGIPETSAFVIATLSHPFFTRPVQPQRNQSIEWGPFPVVEGRTKSSFGFTFDHPYERVPGDWKIQISFQHEVVAEKSFHVVARP